jgi:hypothetical protein
MTREEREKNFLIIRDILTYGRPLNSAGMGITALEKCIVSSLPIVFNRRPICLTEFSIRNQDLVMEMKGRIPSCSRRRLETSRLESPVNSSAWLILVSKYHLVSSTWNGRPVIITTAIRLFCPSQSSEVWGMGTTRVQVAAKLSRKRKQSFIISVMSFSSVLCSS